MAQEIVATVQLPHPLGLGIKTPKNQKTLITELSFPGKEKLSTAQGGGGSVEASIWPYRFKVAGDSEVANFDHNFYWTSRLFEPISIFPGDST